MQLRELNKHEEIAIYRISLVIRLLFQIYNNSISLIHKNLVKINSSRKSSEYKDKNKLIRNCRILYK